MLYFENEPHSHSPETRRALNAADGYLFLDLPEEALKELNEVLPRDRGDAAVLLGRTRVLLHMRRWRDAERLAALGSAEHPDHDEFTVQRAFALHQLKRGKQARNVLLAAPEWVRRSGILHYNLACYEAQLGDLKTARQCIDTAIKMNAAMRKNAKADPDLKGLSIN
jgi:tetratricopeptide (TPR) repeat protein